MGSGIGETDRRLREWVEHVLGPVAVVADMPEPEAAAEVVLYPLGLAATQATRDARHPEPHRFLFEYLVATQGDGAHERLGTLLVAALERAEWQVDLDAASPQLWLSMGVPPRPAFVLTVEAVVPRPPPQPAGPVMRPLTVDVTPTRGLAGQVVGPSSVPVPGVRVELVGLGVHTRADSDGHFGFSAVPAHDEPVRLRITAKGREFVAAARLPEGDEPVVIHCDLLED